jgi:hypothetical protein
MPSGTSSGSVAELRAERTGDVDLLYLPNPLCALLNRLLLRRQMRKVDSLLEGLKQTSERPGAQVA